MKRPNWQQQQIVRATKIEDGVQDAKVYGGNLTDIGAAMKRLGLEVPAEIRLRDLVISVITEATGITIERTAITLQGNRIFLHVPGALKHVIVHHPGIKRGLETIGHGKWQLM